MLCRYKIIVTTAQQYYQSIKTQLDQIGLTENVDYVMYQQFIMEWYYKNKNKINVLKTDMPLTARCTLNCEKCVHFLPYWKAGRKEENSAEYIENDIDIYFQCVDYVWDFNLVGGEPFLYKDIKEIVEYIGKNYRDRIGYAGFITNGTIVPDDEVLELMQRYSFGVSISDYSDEIVYKNKIEELCERLGKYEITYMRNRNIEWYDFGFLEEKYHYEGESAVAHMRCCNTICHILDDGKIYYCSPEWAAQKGGLILQEEKAYVDLKRVASGEIEKEEILEMMMGNISGGYLEFCKVCGGFGTDNNNRVKTAQQWRKNEWEKKMLI